MGPAPAVVSEIKTKDANPDAAPGKGQSGRYCQIDPHFYQYINTGNSDVDPNHFFVEENTALDVRKQYVGFSPDGGKIVYISDWLLEAFPSPFTEEMIIERSLQKENCGCIGFKYCVNGVGNNNSLF